MPKETVYGDSFKLPGGEPQRPVIQVRWGKDEGEVQIVTHELNHEIPPPEEQHEPWSCVYGYGVTMNRRSVNDLIRHLRKARDQAFGRDE